MSEQSLHDAVQKRSVHVDAGDVLCLPLIVATLVAGRDGMRGRIRTTSTRADA
ncbi:hypothetical protein [Streptomyces sp. F001]|uniref:hypothetical protein n=1 Tax=Streptomyces sp. F001 TaxID=1510026 RepID=UPI0013EE6125|nr:hypothetical protein [Streptomyces sp. F001]